MPVAVQPITEEAIEPVCRFLHEELNPDLTIEQWRAAFDPPWDFRGPNRGFMLLDGGAVTGVLGGIYAQRALAGRTESFCNLFGWCVLPDYRRHSLKLLSAALSQRQYHFTDFSPRPDLIPLLERFGFVTFHSPTVILPNVPVLPLASRSTIVSGEEAAPRLQGQDLQTLRDHGGAGAVRHLVTDCPDGACHVVFRLHRRKGLPCATVLHASQPKLLMQQLRALGSYFLFQHGAAATIVERRAVPAAPLLSVPGRRSPTRAILSTTLSPADIDYLYSELMLLPFY